jgi:ankyrin repeat protein
LFLPADVAHEIYADAINFFEQFYLGEFCENHKNTSTLAHALMRLIKQRYLPEKKFAQIRDLIQKHINTTEQQDIMMVELIIMRWQLSKDPAALTEFDQELQKLGIIIDEQFSDRTRLVAHLIAGKLDDRDIECYRKLSITEQVFAGYNILHLAILNDHIEQVTTLHQLNEHLITFSTWYHQDVLCLAQSVEMAKTLVKLGAPKTRTEYDNALDYAIKGGNTNLLAFLLEAGLKPSKLSLYYASSRDIGMVQLLLKHHPESINKHTHGHRTPLHMASEVGKLDIVQELIRHGADPTTRDINGVTSLQTALEKDKQDVAEYYVGHTDRFFQTPYRGDKIVTMIRSPRLQQKFVENQTAAETDAVYYQTFQEQLKPKVIIKEDIDHLLFAVRKSDIRAVRGCLEQFPQQSATTNSNHYCTTPVHEAILGLARQEGEEYKKRLEIVKLLLLTDKLDINGISHTSEPAIFMATSINNVDVLDIFLTSDKLDINKQDNLGYTALHDAVERGCVDSVRRLLQDARIDISITNEDGETAEDVNSSTQAREIKKLFVEYKAQQRAANQQTSSCLNLNF